MGIHQLAAGPQQLRVRQVWTVRQHLLYPQAVTQSHWLQRSQATVRQDAVWERLSL